MATIERGAGGVKPAASCAGLAACACSKGCPVVCAEGIVDALAKTCPETCSELSFEGWPEASEEGSCADCQAMPRSRNNAIAKWLRKAAPGDNNTR